jgi:hypothetical protein
MTGKNVQSSSSSITGGVGGANVTLYDGVNGQINMAISAFPGTLVGEFLGWKNPKLEHTSFNVIGGEFSLAGIRAGLSFVINEYYQLEFSYAAGIVATHEYKYNFATGESTNNALAQIGLGGSAGFLGWAFGGGIEAVYDEGDLTSGAFLSILAVEPNASYTVHGVNRNDNYQIDVIARMDFLYANRDYENYSRVVTALTYADDRGIPQYSNKQLLDTINTDSAGVLSFLSAGRDLADNPYNPMSPSRSFGNGNYISTSHPASENAAAGGMTPEERDRLYSGDPIDYGGPHGHTPIRYRADSNLKCNARGLDFGVKHFLRCAEA